MLELHAADALAFASVADRSDEGGHGADRSVSGTQAGHLGGEVEVFRLDAHAGGHHGRNCGIALSNSQASTRVTVWLARRSSHASTLSKATDSTITRAVEPRLIQSACCRLISAPA